jgi:hypothetical protein
MIRNTNSLILSKIQPHYCREKLKLPIRPKNMDPSFREKLTAAYDYDFQRKDVLALGFSPVYWYKKVSFNDP